MTHSTIDKWIGRFDSVLRTISGVPKESARIYPATDIAQDTNLSAAEKKHAIQLMRINHAGEIAAQGLYHGQAVTACSRQTADSMMKNAHEESDHLYWCHKRLHQLGGRTSMLSIFWYTGSVAIGMVAGLAGDHISHAFVKETELQVTEHLQSHLDEISPNDKITRIIIEQIQADEAEHATHASRVSHYDMPNPIKQLMRISARVMTTTARWL